MRLVARVLPALTVCLLSVFHGSAQGGVPSAANSTVTPCLVACPLGDITFSVVVRDIANNPLAGASVVLDFSSCPEAFICTTPGMTPDPYTVFPESRLIRMFTDALGSTNFPLRVGGLCALATVSVFANGTLLATRGLASPDQDGNGVVVSVIGNDDPLYLPKVGTNDPTADFDCDGDVDPDDTFIFYAHHSHACEGFVDPARRSTWGRVKSFYR